MRAPVETDASDLFEEIEPIATPRARQPGSRVEREMYIEDVLDHVPNKYLAVNIASRRARALNERELPVGEAAKQAKKPTTQALLELIEGRLKYELIPLHPTGSETDGELDEDTDADIAQMFEELEESDSDDDFDVETATIDDFDEDS